MAAACLILVQSMFPVDTPAAQELVRVGGTGGMLSVLETLGKAFRNTRPDAVITVMPSLGSTGGIKAVLDGVLDIGVSSRVLNAGEQGADAREFVHTPFVFATAMSNPVSNVTIQELVDIYSGKKSTWPDNEPIRLVLRPSTEFDTMLLKRLSPDIDRAVTDALGRQGMIVAITDQDSATSIEKVPHALGTTTLGQIISEKRKLKALSLNGVKPGLSVSDAAYPYFKTFYLVTKRDLRPVARQFIDFLYSSRGRDILTRSGYRLDPI